MSFGFGVGDFLTVLDLANTLRKRFVDSPDQFNAIADEVKSLSNSVRDLDDLSLSRNLDTKQKDHLFDISRSCKSLLRDLDSLIDKYQELDTHPTTIGGKTKRLWKRLRFEPQDVEELRLRLASNVGQFNAFYASLTNKQVHAIDGKVDQLLKHADDEERKALYRWLSTDDYSAQLTDLLKRRQDGTGQWLLDSDEFKEWIDGKTPILFCPGIPGAGKTILACTVIERLQLKARNDETVGLCYMFCNYKRQSEQNIEHFLSSILKQLALMSPSIPNALKDLYLQHGEQNTRPSAKEYIGVLKTVMAQFSHIYVVVDALDECSLDESTADGNVQRKLFAILSDLQLSTRAQLFATSRSLPDVLNHFAGHTRLDIRADEGDVRQYLESELLTLHRCVRQDHDLQQKICSTILDVTNGMFLLAKLHIDSLRYETRPRMIYRALEKLPSGTEALNIAYQRAIERIERQPAAQLRDLAKQTLCWMTYAKRRLKTSELQHALAIEDAAEFDEGLIPDLGDILDACVGLITINKEIGIFEFVHDTTREYFTKHIDSWVKHTQQKLLRDCLLYLSYENMHNWVCKSWEDYNALLQRYAFLEYSVRYWGDHAQQCTLEVWEDLAIKLLRDSRKLTTIIQLVYFGARYMQGPVATWSDATSVHLAARLGLVDLVECLVMKYSLQLDAKDEGGCTPLMWAAERGQCAVIQWFLNRATIDVNSQNKWGATALTYALRSECDPAVEMLLQHHGLDPNLRVNGRTPLAVAAAYGQSRAVRILLGHDRVQVNAEDEYGNTPLFNASVHENAEVVELLLKHKDIEVNVRTNNGSTALEQAVRYGAFSIAKLILNHPEVDPNLVGDRGSPPLNVAAGVGDYKMVELLLECSRVDANARCVYGESALSSAVSGWFSNLISPAHWEKDYPGVMKLMLKHEKFEVDYDALLFAAEYGILEAVELLLHYDKVELDVRDRNGETLLSLAVSGWHTYSCFKVTDHAAVIEVLLACNQIPVNARDRRANTPLILAARYGFQEAVALLLAHSDIDVNAADYKGRTALIHAKKGGYETIVSMLESCNTKEGQDSAREKSQECAEVVYTSNSVDTSIR